MKMDELELEALKGLLAKESDSLQAALLNGSSWEELKDQRQKVTALSIIVHKKINSSKNPAESTDRSEKRVQR